MNQRANTLLHIESIYPTLTPAERRVADEVVRNPHHVVHWSITELAKRAGVSDATVVKFCKRLGYKGFQEFKILLAQDVAVRPFLAQGEVEPGNDVRTIKEKIFQANITALQNTVQVLDDEALEAAVEALVKAREIHFYGLGPSGIAALDAEQKFSRIGRRASAVVDTHMQITRAVMLQPGDVVIGISASGTRARSRPLQGGQTKRCVGDCLNQSLLVTGGEGGGSSLVDLHSMESLYQGAYSLAHFPVYDYRRFVYGRSVL